MSDQPTSRRPLSTGFVPDPTQLHLLGLAVEAQGIIAHVTTTAPHAECPVCHQPSARVHSHYVRRVADLPWQGVAVLLSLRVRRFFCDNAACRRQIFVERLPAIVAPYARHTVRLEEVLTLLGLVLGGEAGARVVQVLGLHLSPDRLLARIRAAALPAVADGCRNGYQLWQEIRAQGYTRSQSNVARFVTRLRREGPSPRAAGRRGATVRISPR